MMHKTSKKGEADVKSNFINNHNREPRYCLKLVCGDEKWKNKSVSHLGASNSLWSHGL